MRAPLVTTTPKGKTRLDKKVAVASNSVEVKTNSNNIRREISEKEVQAIMKFVQQEQPKFKTKFSVGDEAK